MEVRSVFNRGPRVQIEFAKKGRTKQSMKDECDINLIMAKYQKTGAIAHLNRHGADYGFATSEDFASAMRTVTVAQDMFDHLPSSIRNRFANNPAAFLDFVQDADNRQEAIELGLFAAEQAGGAGGSEAEPNERKEDEAKPKEDPPEGDSKV